MFSSELHVQFPFFVICTGSRSDPRAASGCGARHEPGRNLATLDQSHSSHLLCLSSSCSTPSVTSPQHYVQRIMVM
jgi:hypothetical protein